LFFQIEVSLNEDQEKEEGDRHSDDGDDISKDDVLEESTPESASLRNKKEQVRPT